MALNPTNLDAVVLSAGSTLLSVSPAQTITFLKVTACNTNNAPVTINVNRLPNGGTAMTSNLLIDALSIGAGATVVLPLSGKSLINQQGLFASASVNSVVNLAIDYATSP